MEITKPETKPVVEPVSTFGSSSRWKGRFHLFASIFLLFYNVLIINIIAYRHPWRIDLTEERIYGVSNEARSRLALLQDEVKVIVALRYQRDNPQDQANARVFQRTLDVIKEFSAVQPLVNPPIVVDAFQQPDRWTSLCTEYGLLPTQFNRVILSIGGDKGQLKQALSPKDLAVFGDVTDPSRPREVREYRIERALLSSFTKLMNRDRHKVYSTIGHGELGAIPSAGARSADMNAFRSDLTSSGYEIAALNNLSEGVPQDASALIIPGPTEAFSEEEISVLDRYLQNDGALFVALAPQRTGLEGLLEKWGIKVLDGTVMTERILPGQRIEQSFVRVGGFNGIREITKPFNASTFRMTIFSPRPLEVKGGLKGMLTESLLNSGKSTETERFVLKDDDGLERREVFSLAAITLPEPVERPPPGWTPRNARVVVIGSRDLMRDIALQGRGGYLAGSHRDFIMNSVHWLCGQENLANLGGEATLTRALPTLNPSLKRFLFFASVVIFPGLFALIGLGVYFLRRS